MISHRESSIQSLDEAQFYASDCVMTNSANMKKLCDELARKTSYSNMEWLYTIICAVADYTGNESLV